MQYASYLDNGIPMIDCTECEKGVNGKDLGTCFRGFLYRKPWQNGCPFGVLLDGIEL